LRPASSSSPTSNVVIWTARPVVHSDLRSTIVLDDRI
jgi:hypothetical protein